MVSVKRVATALGKTVVPLEGCLHRTTEQEEAADCVRWN